MRGCTRRRACWRGTSSRRRFARAARQVDGQPTVIIDSVFAFTNAFMVVKAPTEKRFLLSPVAPDLLSEGLPRADRRPRQRSG